MMKTIKEKTSEELVEATIAVMPRIRWVPKGWTPESFKPLAVPVLPADGVWTMTPDKIWVA